MATACTPLRKSSVLATTQFSLTGTDGSQWMPAVSLTGSTVVLRKALYLMSWNATYPTAHSSKYRITSILPGNTGIPRTALRMTQVMAHSNKPPRFHYLTTPENLKCKQYPLLCTSVSSYDPPHVAIPCSSIRPRRSCAAMALLLFPAMANLQETKRRVVPR